MKIPYNPFLSGPDAELLVQPGDRVVVVPADKVPSDRFGFNHLASDPDFRGADADLFYAAFNWLSFMGVSMGETDSFDGDAQRIQNLTDEEGCIHLIYTRMAREAGLDIRA